MNVTVFVPIQMNIEGIDKESEVRVVLNAMDDIITLLGLEADPRINIELVGDSEIVVDDEQDSLTKEEKAMLKDASQLLSVDCDEDLIFMVTSIVNHENQGELIDYIDGVNVWEKVKFEFTVKQFCDLIGYTGTEFKTKN